MLLNNFIVIVIAIDVDLCWDMYGHMHGDICGDLSRDLYRNMHGYLSGHLSGDMHKNIYGGMCRDLY